MTADSEWINRILAERRWDFTVTLQITAGWGCVVLEVFERDAPKPQIPLRRELLSA